MKINLLFLLFIVFVYGSVSAQTKVKIKTPVKKAAGSFAISTKASIERGKAVYAANCLTCHQPDGSGVPMMNPPLIKTKWVLGDKSVLINQVLKGSKNTVEIDGDTFHNTMPAQAHLSDEQIADVITYVRNSFGNKASAVSVTQVKQLRAKLTK
jgi:Cytochrome c, mono- and diheme variants